MSFESSYELVPLGKLAQFINGDRGENYPKPTDYVERGVPFISATDVDGGYVSWDQSKQITSAAFTKLRGGKVQRGDILFCLRGSLGKLGYVEKEVEGAIASSLVILRAENPSLSRYLRFVLSSAQAQEAIKSLDNGSVQGNISAAALKSLQVPCPPEEARVAITEALDVLELRIDLNRRINQTLEAMAQAIFKSWFVDFDPVKAKVAAKTEGRDPLRAAMTAISGKPDAELDTLPPDQFTTLAATAALFPDEIEDSELGAIPAGWISSRIGDVTTRVAMGPFGSDIKKDNFVEAGVPVIRGGNLTDGLVEKGYVFLTEAKADELKNANAFPGDIVITHRGTLGQVGLIPARSKFPRYVVSQSQMLLSADCTRMSPRYLFEFIRSDVGKHLLLSNTSQVGVPAIARPTGSVKSVPLVVPPKAVLDAYDDLLKPILLELTHLANSADTLVELRDALLPKLLSGELQVHKAEAEVAT